jgi:hypothetical protein
MLKMFGRSKPLPNIQIIAQEKNLSEFRKIRYILELEGFICTLDSEFAKSGNLRKAINRLKADYNSTIYLMDCDCNNKQKAKLNANGTPRKHKAYILEWAR